MRHKCHGTCILACDGIRKSEVICYDWKTFVEYDAQIPWDMQEAEWLQSHIYHEESFELVDVQNE